MSTVTDPLPLLGLRITAGPLQLRGITDDDLMAPCGLAERGIHDRKLALNQSLDEGDIR